MKVRRTACVLSSLLIVGLAGCSGSGSDANSASPNASSPTDATTTDLSGEVTMWIYPIIPDEAAHKTFWADQVAAFNEKYPDVKVNVEIFPWANRDESLATAIAGGKGPDVVYLIPDQLPKYESSIEAIDSYLPSEHADDILDNVKESLTFDGKMLGSPILTSSNALMCDKVAFDAIGETTYPTTWDDLMALAPKFKEKDIYVTQYWGSAEVTLNMTFYPLLWQAGGQVLNDAGTDVAFNSDAGVKALQFVTDLAQNGYIEKDLLTTSPSMEQTAITQNKVACTWQSAPTDVTSYWGEENIIITDPLKDVDAVSYGTVGALSMLNDAKDKDAAGAWIDFATSAPVVKEYVTAAKYFSPLKSTGTLYTDPIYSAIEATIPMSTVGQLSAKSRDVMGVLAPEIQAALLGDKSPQQALDDAAAAAQGMLG